MAQYEEDYIKPTIDIDTLSLTATSNDKGSAVTGGSGGEHSGIHFGG